MYQARNKAFSNLPLGGTIRLHVGNVLGTLMMAHCRSFLSLMSMIVSQVIPTALEVEIAYVVLLFSKFQLKYSIPFMSLRKSCFIRI